MGSDEVRRAAAQVHHIAQEVRRSADRALAARSLPWSSSAGTAFRARLSAEAHRIVSAAVELEAAADELISHAVAVELAESAAKRPESGYPR